jgi:hypothetical protein
LAWLAGPEKRDILEPQGWLISLKDRQAKEKLAVSYSFYYRFSIGFFAWEHF